MRFVLLLPAGFLSGFLPQWTDALAQFPTVTVVPAHLCRLERSCRFLCLCFFSQLVSLGRNKELTFV